MLIKSVNSTMGEVLEEFSELTKPQTSEILTESLSAYNQWKETDFSERKILLKNAAQILREDEELYSKLITLERGKPISQAKAEVMKCAWVCDFYAHHGDTFLADENIETDADRNIIRYIPIGTIMAIMPWNFPFW